MRPMSLSDRAELVLAALIVAVLVFAAVIADHRAKHPALPAPAASANGAKP